MLPSIRAGRPGLPLVCCITCGDKTNTLERSPVRFMLTRAIFMLVSSNTREETSAARLDFSSSPSFRRTSWIRRQ
jgi:hypothetical protein